MNMIEKGKQDLENLERRLEHPRQIIFTIARVLLGLEFFKQGITKIDFGNHYIGGKYLGGLGWAGTLDEFKFLHIPFPEFSLFITILIEVVCGIMLIVGFMVPIASLVLILEMIIAVFTVTHKFGFDMTAGGWELNVIFIIALLMVGVANYGRYGADEALIKKCCK